MTEKIPAESSRLNPRSFAWFLSARCATIIAYQMVGVAVGWQVYDLTHRALDLGLVGLVQFIPSVLLVLVVGHAADRYDRRRLVSLAFLVESLALLALIAAILGRWINRELIFLFVFVVGIARAFEFTTMQTLVPSIVDREALPSALALNASVTQASIIIGPMMGGFIYVAGPAAVYGTSCTLLLFSAVVMCCIRIRSGIQRREQVGLRTLFAGISFIRSRPVLFGAISFDLFAVLLGGATALLPVYARDILHTSPRGLGLLRAAPAVGAFAASVFLARHPPRRRIGRLMFAAVAWFGIGTMIFAVSTNFALSFLSLVLLGCADMISVVIRASLVQLETPDEMRGRVSAVNSVFIGASNQLGEFESGLTATWFGVVPAVLIGGLGTLAIVALWFLLFPELARRDRLQPGEA